MKFYVGVTDRTWYENLSAQKPDEVNFWKPSGKNFRALFPGEPLLFKLRSPNNFIVGLGYFVKYSQYPMSYSWDIFGNKNGYPDYLSFKKAITEITQSSTAFDPTIGNIVLTQPEFFPRERWIHCPASFASNIVSGKTYDTDTTEGDWLWADVVHAVETAGRYGVSSEVRHRLGQSGFRVLVTEAYDRRCAITGEKTLPVLQAAHIKPYGQGPNVTSNGILLRSDLHALYDNGLITVTPDYKVEVSGKIHDLYGNGKQYYALQGQSLTVVPTAGQDRPRQDLLEWHNQNVYEQ